MARDLFEEQGIDLFADQAPVDLFEQTPQKTNWREDLGMGVASAKNTADTAFSLSYGGLANLFSEKKAADIYESMQKRLEARTKEANPEGKEQSFGGKVISALPNILTYPLSPFETGKTAVDTGESLGKAQTMAGIDTLGNMAGLALPGALGGKLLTKAATGGAINAAQDYATRSAFSAIADKQETKDVLGPSAESAGLSFVMGGVLGPMSPSKKSKTIPKPITPAQTIADIVAAEKTTSKVKPPLATEGTQELLPSNAPQYGIDHSNDSGHWTVGPDGMPFRADLSMEAQALQNPLQRDLWGEELAPAQGAERSLTEAIDAMPDKQPAVDLLSPELQAPEALTKAADLDTPTMELPSKPTSGTGSPDLSGGMGRGQSGQIDPDLLSLGLTKLFHGGREFKKWDPRTIGSGEGMGVMGPGLYAGDQEGLAKLYTKYGATLDENGLSIKPGVLNEMAVDMSKFFDPRKKMTAEQVAAHNQAIKNLDDLGLRASSRGLKGALQNASNKQKAREAVVKAGVDGIWEDLGPGYGREIVIYNPEVIAQVSRTDTPIEKFRDLSKGLGKNQSGRFDFNMFEGIGKGLSKLRNIFGGPKDSVDTPISPENIAKKQEKASKYKALKIALPEYTDPATAEEALALSKVSKDISSTKVGQQMAPGLNFMAAYHNHPLLKYGRKLVYDAKADVSKFTKKYLTDENGVSTLTTKLAPEDKVPVANLLYELDKQQVDYTDAIGTKLGLSDTAKKYMEAHARSMEAEWVWRKGLADAAGLEIGPKRRGHSPGIFNGDYKSFVLDKDGNIAHAMFVDTPGEFELAKKYYEDKYPGSKFTADTWQEARKSITGSNNKYFQYNDLGKLMDLFSGADKDFANLQNKVNTEIARATNDMFNFNVHDIKKRGITGNLGNKPWLSPEKNAQQRLDAVVKYLEEAAEHHALQKATIEMNHIVQDDATSHLPKTKKYLDDYWKNMTGQNTNGLGTIANLVFSGGVFTAEFLSQKVPYAKDIIGPGNVIKASNIIKNKMSQIYMGMYNFSFFSAQLLHPLQVGTPVLQLVANRIGASELDMAASIKNGSSKFLWASLADAAERKQFPFKLPVDHQTKKAIAWAQERGILDFSELERVYEGHKTAVGREWDRRAEWSMQAAERLTRPPMFLMFVDLLSKSEKDLDVVLPYAEKLTNQVMVDYHKWERPQFYQGLGVMGPHTGGLTTFKHSNIGTQALLVKEMAKPGMKAKLPAALSAMNMLALAGVTGVAGYETVDAIYQFIREQAFGERRSIAQDTMENLPQWMKTGALSSAFDLNAQGKFSAAGMVPDSLDKALFPHLSGAFDIGKSAVTAATNPTENNLANLAVTATPSGWKQATKSAVKRDEEDWLIDSRGKRDVQRTPEQWDKSSITGLAPLQESVDRNRDFQNVKNEKVRMQALIATSARFKEMVLDGNDDAIADALNEYADLGGDAAALFRQIPKIHEEAQMGRTQRLEGKPTTPQGARRYEAYQN